MKNKGSQVLKPPTITFIDSSGCKHEYTPTMTIGGGTLGGSVSTFWCTTIVNYGLGMSIARLNPSDIYNPAVGVLIAACRALEEVAKVRKPVNGRDIMKRVLRWLDELEATYQEFLTEDRAVALALNKLEDALSNAGR